MQKRSTLRGELNRFIKKGGLRNQHVCVFEKRICHALCMTIYPLKSPIAPFSTIPPERLPIFLILLHTNVKLAVKVIRFARIISCAHDTSYRVRLGFLSRRKAWKRAARINDTN